MLKFSAKDLKPVLQEARKNHCGVVLVKDHGVYIMSEIGALTSHGRKVAYAKGYHPDKDFCTDGRLRIAQWYRPFS
ncbi:DUF3085 domain-containing protein [Salmonella enterica]|nr:DUF3085 domain-containing protein [Salmonella enterica]EBD7685565.1 DUF3085 domain-containing protein [Salmonella enterica]